MIGPVYRNGPDATPWQLIAEGVLAGDPYEMWKEVVVLQMLEAPYPVVVMEKEDSRWKKMARIGDVELVKMGADRRAEKRRGEVPSGEASQV